MDQNTLPPESTFTAGNERLPMLIDNQHALHPGQGLADPGDAGVQLRLLSLRMILRWWNCTKELAGHAPGALLLLPNLTCTAGTECIPGSSAVQSGPIDLDLADDCCHQMRIASCKRG